MSAVTLGLFHPSGPSGRYHPIAQLGRGGMSEVHLAVARGPAGFNKLVVLKRLLPNLVAESHYLEMFLDEARLAARLNHPNIVQTNEVSVSGEKYFIAMEYLEGQPLLKVVQRLLPRPLPVPLALRIVAKVCAGLHYAHTLADFGGAPLGIVHRDVSPHNIFVTYAGQVKVVDFGIAKAASQTTETVTGVLKGKIAYMSPEQVSGAPLDGRSDLFALGVVLYEAVTGQRLWGSPTRDVNIVKRLITGDVPCSPRKIAPNLSEDVDRICRRALALDREQRYASALEMQEAVEEAIARLPRRSSDRDVGETIATLFEAERQSIAAIIETQLAALDTGSSAEFSRPSVPALGIPTSAIFSMAAAKEFSAETMQASRWRWKAATPQRRRALLALLVLLAIFGLVGAVALWGLPEGVKAKLSAGGPAPSASAAPAPAAPAGSLPAPSASDTGEADRPPAPASAAAISPAAPAPRRVPVSATPRPVAAPEATATPATPAARASSPPAASPPASSPRAAPSAAPTFGPLDDRL